MKKRTKKKVVKKSKFKGPTLLDRLPKNEGERIELMIRLTQKAIRPGSSDNFLQRQIERLEKELEAWKQSNPA